jgi:SAM-dependent methyltransferase
MSTIPLRDLYTKHPQLYDEMIQGEDFQGNLIPALHRIYPLDHAIIAEFGAGTGRITIQLAPRVQAIHAFDLMPSMVILAQQKLKGLKLMNWILGVADSRKAPLATASANIAIEGWSIAQIMAWHPDTWQNEVERVIGEMIRVVRPGGAIMLIENLGTGTTTPHPPDRFVPLYDYFEKRLKLSMTWIRTDIRYPSRSEAQRTTGAVFGDEAVEQGWELTDGFMLPECTGIWWKRT